MFIAHSIIMNRVVLYVVLSPEYIFIKYNSNSFYLGYASTLHFMNMTTSSTLH